ncbi:MAG: methyltransferase domain-containing protein [Candidatus Nomurabacteria bacterium]|jgi:SAM-dependent methyltransferase|nr:methyltransferase domain-containing protein [Candidatus Nomurabacteria bacterium]
MTNQDYWQQKHTEYGKNGHTHKPSIFAKEFAKVLTAGGGIKGGKLLELGAGLGQDGRYFQQLGFEVVSTDQLASKGIQSLNMREQPWPFASGQFDTVYAHLSLHYFDDITTQKIFAEIYRVLKPGGVLAFLVNSKSDPEYDQSQEIEDGLIKIGDRSKRFFDVKMAQSFAKDFTQILADDGGETYKDAERGIHHLIRFVGKK